MPGATVASLVAGVVVVSVDHLRRARAEAARNGAPFDHRLTALLAAAEQAEAAILALQARVPQPVPPPVPYLAPAGSEDQGSLLTSLDVARLAGVSERAVRKAAARGRLVGRRTDSRWEFGHAQAHAWINRRAART